MTPPAEAPREETTSPQQRWKCACPSWSTRRECLRDRYDFRTIGADEECECACHEREDDYDDPR